MNNTTAQNDAASLSPSLSGNGTAAGLTYSWAASVTVVNGQVVSGYYDTNKSHQGDSELCWAAAASNMLAWWQDATGSGTASGSEAIYAAMKESFENVGGYADEACRRWLEEQGVDDVSLSFNNVMAAERGEQLSATALADELASALDRGGMVALNVYRHDGLDFYGGHALTLWGVSRDAATGELASVHVTDSDDGQQGVVEIALRYDAELGCYRLVGGAYEGFCIGSYMTLLGGKNAQEQESVFDFSLSGEETAAFTLSPVSAEVAAQGVASTLRTGATGATYVQFTWARGVVTRNNLVVGGFYDADKLQAGTGGVDCYMCWAASASNLIAWWQNTYATAFTVSATVATTAAAVYKVFKQYWENEGGYTEAGCQWWLAGGANTANYRWLYTNVKKDGESGGAYYSRFYSTSNVTQIAYRTGARNRSALVVANEMVAKFNRGCGLSISLGNYLSDGTRKSGHALTIWGITRNTVTGEITALHYTDSNDGTQTVIVASVRYNSSVGMYEITKSDKYNNYVGWYLDNYETIEPFTRQNVLNPTRLTANRNGKTVTFSWSGEQRKGMSYEVAWQESDAASATFRTCSSKSLSVSFTASGNYTWWVRAMNGDEALTDWVCGGTISVDFTAPVLTVSGITMKKTATGKSAVTLNWGANETATFTLTIDGKQVYKGSNTSFSYTLGDGTHTYTLTATDAAGNSSSKSGSFECETGAVTNPANLSFKLLNQGEQVSFSWGSVYDKDGVTYELACKTAGSSSYTYYTDLSSPNITLNLLVYSNWNWAVRAVDGKGNTSDWVYGTNFHNDIKAPTITLNSPKLTKQGTNKTKTTLSWGADEKATYTLTIDGKQVYKGSATSRSFTLADGTHNYTLTATDARGNSSSKSGSFVCDTGVVAAPGNLSVTVTNQGEQAYFSWSSVYDKDGITYEMACKTSTGKTYTVFTDLSSPEITLIFPSETLWVWRVRAVDGNGNASAWVQGRAFHNDLTAPTITLKTPTLKKQGSNKTNTTLSWGADEKATYTLTIDGKQVYKGSATSRSFTLADGTHNYTITATDARGNSSSKSGSFVCDTGAVAAPANLSVTVTNQGEQAYFSWSSVYDKDGITYEMACKTDGESGYKVYTGLNAATITLNLLVKDDWLWRVRAVDGNGNASAWVQGRAFHNDLTAPTITLKTPTLTKQGTNKTKTTLSWGADEKATYTLTIDGKQVYKGSATSRSFTLADGTHNYTITATDARGNSSSKSGSFTCDTVAPASPGRLTVRVSSNGKQAVFTWAGVQDGSGVTYELGCKTDGESGYKVYTGLNAATITLNLLVKDDWLWRVRAVDGNGNASAWVQGRAFHNDLTAPTITLKTPTLTKQGTNKTKTTLSWGADEKATYTLTIDGKQVYKGSATSRSFTLADGTHNYTITAMDAHGNTSSKSGSFTCDTVAPASPGRLTVRVSSNGKQAVFTWAGVQDGSGVTYELGCKTDGESGYKVYTGLNAATITLNLLVKDDWLWRVRAVDGRGNASAWSQGVSFDNYVYGSAGSAANTAALTGSAATLDHELDISAGNLTLSGEAQSLSALDSAAADLALGTEELTAEKRGLALAATL